jgi:CBS domain containing-hemolysin-like protein
MFTVRAILVFETIFRPFIWMLDRASQAALRVAGVRGQMTEPGQMHSLEELRMHFIDVYERGLLNQQQEEMLHSVIEFTQLEAKDVMTPRPELESLEENQTIGDLLDATKESGHSRFPVYREKPENIVGYLSINDVLKVIREEATALRKPIKALAHSIKYVPENKRVSALFHEMQRERVPMVAVVNEFSDTEGIVTLNGLAEEIVGQLERTKESEPLFERVDRHTIRVDGQFRMDHANEQLKLKLPEKDEYQTIAGFILYQLQRIPREGDALRHEHLKLIVERMDGPRIDKVLIQGL